MIAQVFVMGIKDVGAGHYYWFRAAYSPLIFSDNVVYTFRHTLFCIHKILLFNCLIFFIL